MKRSRVTTTSIGFSSVRSERRRNSREQPQWLAWTPMHCNAGWLEDRQHIGHVRRRLAAEVHAQNSHTARIARLPLCKFCTREGLEDIRRMATSSNDIPLLHAIVAGCWSPVGVRGGAEQQRALSAQALQQSLAGRRLSHQQHRSSPAVKPLLGSRPRDASELPNGSARSSAPEPECDPSTNVDARPTRCPIPALRLAS